MSANVGPRPNEMASNILIGNAKAVTEVQLNLENLSEEEKELILKVLERDKLIQNELSIQLQSSPNEKLSTDDELISGQLVQGLYEFLSNQTYCNYITNGSCICLKYF